MRFRHASIPYTVHIPKIYLSRVVDSQISQNWSPSGISPFWFGPRGDDGPSTVLTTKPRFYPSTTVRHVARRAAPFSLWMLLLFGGHTAEGDKSFSLVIGSMKSNRIPYWMLGCSYLCHELTRFCNLCTFYPYCWWKKSCTTWYV